MHLPVLKATSLFLTALAFLTTAVAVPAPGPAPNPAAPPTSCTTIHPAIARVDAARPVESYLPGFHISQNANGAAKQDTFAEFTVPRGVWGCTLSYSFPRNYPISTVGLAPVEVFSVAGPLSRSPRGIDISWDFCPAPISMVGSVKFESSPSGVTNRVINSFACQPNMSYRLSISKGYAAKTSVSFVQSATAGLRMTYNC
ncbi:uncharacterized protein BDV17DRAFT_270204 [Aspergillus undulatus]|uniref:uncharacterized protein n=1 Tax=Aspergillus undulatus TaxID=1810928 RepID=UPI003CCD6B25